MDASDLYNRVPRPVPVSPPPIHGSLDATRTTPSSITLTAEARSLRVDTAALSAEMLSGLPPDGAVEVIGEVAGTPAAVAAGGGGVVHDDGGGGVAVVARIARPLVGYDADLYARSLRMREVFEARYGPGAPAAGAQG